jgi:hypothetical protein
MVEGLLEPTEQFTLNHWLAAGNNVILPPEETPVQVDPSKEGYQLEFKIQAFVAEMSFAHDRKLLSELAKGVTSDHRETGFVSGPQGLLLTSFRLGEDGDDRPVNRIILTYSYQSVGGFNCPGKWQSTAKVIARPGITSEPAVPTTR